MINVNKINTTQESWLNEYGTAVEYIEGDGNQWIQIDYFSNPADEHIEITYQRTSIDGIPMVCGWGNNGGDDPNAYFQSGDWWYYNNTGHKCLGIHYNYSRNYRMGNAIVLEDMEDFDTTKHTIKRDRGIVYYDGLYKGTMRIDSAGVIPNKEASLKFKLFDGLGGDKDGNNPFIFKGRIYSFYAKRYNESNEINLIPFLDKTKKPCMFDTINKKYYYNLGQGEFTYKDKNNGIVIPVKLNILNNIRIDAQKDNDKYVEKVIDREINNTKVDLEKVRIYPLGVKNHISINLNFYKRDSDGNRMNELMYNWDELFGKYNILNMRENVRQSFLSFHYYDSQDTTTRRLVGYNTSFIDIEDVYNQYTKPEKYGRFNVKIPHPNNRERNTSSDGFGFYYYIEDLPQDDESTNLYLDIKFNNATNGETYLMAWMKPITLYSDKTYSMNTSMNLTEIKNISQWISKYGTPLEYLEGTGTQWIDTVITVNLMKR